MGLKSLNVTSSQSWTKPADVYGVLVKAIPPGGGGSSYGGGGGQVRIDFIPFGASSESVTCTIGSAGAGAANGSTAGNGGSVSFGTYLTALGGSGSTSFGPGLGGGQYLYNKCPIGNGSAGGAVGGNGGDNSGSNKDVAYCSGFGLPGSGSKSFGGGGYGNGGDYTAGADGGDGSDGGGGAGADSGYTGGDGGEGRLELFWWE